MVGMMGRGDGGQESEPAAELLVVEGAGHLPMVERPERFEELVSEGEEDRGIPPGLCMVLEKK
ncbi:hypothetical protein EMPG_12339 [Blastomyces silverae]|uniref:Uncharacterized protein n=1 Tax=Blastomyces silverae TaxID=2060906 RepID=A0A0H1BM93_9EURO|nr:hypothetical protein EMPG_12339 [Blastomyces silverae]